MQTTAFPDDTRRPAWGRRLALGGAAAALLVAGGTGVAFAATGGGTTDAGYGVVVDGPPTATDTGDCPWSDGDTATTTTAGDTR